MAPTLTVLVLVVLGVAGCGGGEARLTRAQFLREGNAICARAAAEEVKLATRFRKEEPAVEERPDFLVAPAVVPPLEGELRRLEALDPPRADEKNLLKIFRGMEKGIEDAKEDPIDLLVEETDPFARANQLAMRYGLHACAHSSRAVVRPQSP